MVQDIVKQLVGFLTSIILFLGTLNIEFQWLSFESIEAFEVVLSAGILLAINMYTIFKNHYGFTSKAKRQKAFLEKENLK